MGNDGYRNKALEILRKTGVFDEVEATFITDVASPSAIEHIDRLCDKPERLEWFKATYLGEAPEEHRNLLLEGFFGRYEAPGDLTIDPEADFWRQCKVARAYAEIAHLPENFNFGRMRSNAPSAAA